MERKSMVIIGSARLGSGDGINKKNMEERGL